ncbi:hypothetical protein COO60DRAFT_439574 [Scenedesmus sp. NREL 46B-D3]|nr:hypothetical protein COO60DRAFT_439574 [Scenedesmus sp. NREL 46B-D3]
MGVVLHQGGWVVVSLVFASSWCTPRQCYNLKAGTCITWVLLFSAACEGMRLRHAEEHCCRKLSGVRVPCNPWQGTLLLLVSAWHANLL